MTGRGRHLDVIPRLRGGPPRRLVNHLLNDRVDQEGAPESPIERPPEALYELVALNGTVESTRRIMMRFRDW